MEDPYLDDDYWFSPFRMEHKDMDTKENTALALIEQYGGKVHIVAPATDRKTAGNDLMQPYTTQIKVDPNPNNGEVFKVGSKNLDGQWVDIFTLAKPTLDRIAQGAGITWDAKHTGCTYRDADCVVYRAVGTVRMPDGSRVRIVGEREIDLLVVEQEMQMLQARKVLNYGPKDKGNPYPGKLTEAQREQVDSLVSAELILFRKHRMARAETGAKNRAIRSLGLKSTYTAAELKTPHVIVRWGLNPGHEFAQAEMKALWDADAPALPENPLPDEDLDFDSETVEETLEAPAGTEEASEWVDQETGEIHQEPQEEEPADDRMVDRRPGHYIEYLKFCEQQKAALGDDRYYRALKLFDMAHRTDVSVKDRDSQRNIMAALKAIPEQK